MGKGQSKSNSDFCSTLNSTQNDRNFCGEEEFLISLSFAFSSCMSLPFYILIALLKRHMRSFVAKQLQQRVITSILITAPSHDCRDSDLNTLLLCYYFVAVLLFTLCRT